MIYNEHTELALSTIFAKVCEIGNPDRKTVKDIADFMLKRVHYITIRQYMLIYMKTK